MTDDDKRAATWLQNDSAFLYKCAAECIDGGDDWLAVKVQASAAASSKLAREYQGIEVAS